MSVLGNIFETRAWKLTGGSPLSPQYWVKKMLLGGRETSSGERVDEQRALTYSAIWAAVNIISSAIAYLPWDIYKRISEDTTELQFNDSLGALLQLQPNPYMTAFTWKQTNAAHVLQWGNGYSEIERNNRGDPIRFWPLPPNRTEPRIFFAADEVKPPDWNPRDGDAQLWYEIIEKSNKRVYLHSRDMLHFRGLGFDGLKGYSVIEMAQDSIGNGLAAQRMTGSFFKNGLHLEGALKFPGEMPIESQAALKADKERQHAGAEKAYRFMILENGADWVQMSMSARDAQFIEAQEFTVQDVARWYRIPLHMLAGNKSPTYASVEQQAIEFLNFTLFPMLSPFEQEATVKLLADRGNIGEYYTQFRINAITRGDRASRSMWYHNGILDGFLSPDDIRRDEGMNPIPDGKGKGYLQQSNMIPLGTEPKPAQPPPGPSVVPVKVDGNPALRAIIIEANERINRREARSLRKALKHPDRLKEFCGEFYPVHYEHIRASLTPLCVAEGNDITEARKTVSGIIEAKRSQLRTLTEGANGNLQARMSEYLATLDADGGDDANGE